MIRNLSDLRQPYHFVYGNHVAPLSRFLREFLVAHVTFEFRFDSTLISQMLNHATFIFVSPSTVIWAHVSAGIRFQRKDHRSRTTIHSDITYVNI